jgi:hypothetical protein
MPCVSLPASARVHCQRAPHSPAGRLAGGGQCHSPDHQHLHVACAGAGSQHAGQGAAAGWGGRLKALCPLACAAATADRKTSQPRRGCEATARGCLQPCTQADRLLLNGCWLGGWAAPRGRCERRQGRSSGRKAPRRVLTRSASHCGKGTKGRGRPSRSSPMARRPPARRMGLAAALAVAALCSGCGAFCWRQQHQARVHAHADNAAGQGVQQARELRHDGLWGSSLHRRQRRDQLACDGRRGQRQGRHQDNHTPQCPLAATGAARGAVSTANGWCNAARQHGAASPVKGCDAAQHGAAQRHSPRWPAALSCLAQAGSAQSAAWARPTATPGRPKSPPGLTGCCQRRQRWPAAWRACRRCLLAASAQRLQSCSASRFGGAAQVTLAHCAAQRRTRCGCSAGCTVGAAAVQIDEHKPKSCISKPYLHPPWPPAASGWQ